MKKKSVNFSGALNVHMLSEFFKIISKTGLVPFPPCFENTWVLCLAFPDERYDTMCSFIPTSDINCEFLAFKMFSYALYLKFTLSQFSFLVSLFFLLCRHPKNLLTSCHNYYKNPSWFFLSKCLDQVCLHYNFFVSH